ncbi:DUF6714 family protein [uncultured Microscilla sp.]|uniref:DUF6714 family protein n=1 Tax=uncultured Microscilla sp. TaxID=432653 RepID=UPI0026385A70|nr:DUF6714 family protein [uncultured Microscilla sp.]
MKKGTTNTALIQQIKEAFAPVNKPYNHFGIYSARARDEYNDPTEEEQRLDRELDRYDLTPQQMHECSTSLIFLEPAGFHYYLPAYMILSLNEGNIKDKSLKASMVFSSAEDALSRADADYKIKQHQRLNRMQIEAVIEFLQYLNETKLAAKGFYAKAIGYWEEKLARLK